MKTRISISIVMMVLTGSMISLLAQEGKRYNSREDFGRKNYLIALRSGNEGIINSALMLVMQLQVRQPLLSLGEINATVDSLAMRSESAGVRFNARLAAEVLNTPVKFGEILKYRTDEQDACFLEVAQKIQNNIFGNTLP